jgi:hypothetical protein
MHLNFIIRMYESVLTVALLFLDSLSFFHCWISVCASVDNENECENTWTTTGGGVEDGMNAREANGPG